ncbi:SDR family NAD(P)-dependent oxidoreductase [Kibdelosporangium aridum]|uniref:NAD(P)-dependent dehydrogenase, short-chain alcohol dehydrogenase family n=1 Tax=Kibdelosporangium aridum TaxID=2030 RepID=A0A1Y5XMC6_KIBAR|nr:SDR family oxidoreductase [Kibdelosporangium aridum]SMD06181.1 NAD(P)-dependent dehydrogenase, short-chain alcohol dehydrogenase family [Kibdelosporangium aridum]
MADLRDKTALVTGASRGLGRAIARRLAADGATVIVHYGSNAAKASETVASISAAGGKAYAVQADLQSADGVDKLFAEISAPLDIVVNNAAVFSSTLFDTTVDEFDRVFAVNVKAPFFIIQKALPLMPDGGRIINISSGVTWFAVPELVYSMTKGALNVLGRSLANTLGDRQITVNTVSPGTTHSDMNAWLRDNPEAQAGISGITALGRVGEPEDIADAVSLVASADARWITGEVIEVNGGFYLGPRTPLHH